MVTKINYFRLLFVFTSILASIYSIIGLFMQSIFSYFNQSTGHKELTIINFLIPLWLTIPLLVICFYKIIFLTQKAVTSSTNRIFSFIIFILLILLLLWQIIFIIKLYSIYSNFNFSFKATELSPMLIGILATIYLALSMIWKKLQLTNSLAKVGQDVEAISSDSS
jgi:hypothetical protein